MSFQELFSVDDMEHAEGWRKLLCNVYFSTFLTLAFGFLLTKIGYANIWPLFGSANQLLSALALIACAVFLKKTKRQGAMLWIPMAFMIAVTFSALGLTIYRLGGQLFTTGLDLGNTLQLIFAVLLLLLGIIVAVQGIKKLTEKNEPAGTTTANA